MPRQKKSSFYHTRKRLVIDQANAAKILDYTLSQVESADILGDQLAERFLLIYDRKEIGLAEWKGWCFSRGVLRHGREQWRPENILNDRCFRESLELESRELLKALNPNC